MSKLRLLLLPLCCKCLGDVGESSTALLNSLFPGETELFKETSFIVPATQNDEPKILTATNTCGVNIPQFDSLKSYSNSNLAGRVTLGFDYYVCYKVDNEQRMYYLLGAIGKGQAAVVYRARELKSGTLLAVKVAFTSGNLETEINVLSSLQSDLGSGENFVKLHFFDENHRFMAMDLLETSLYESLKGISDVNRKKFYDDAIRQLTLLYAHGYTHVDSHSDNWLIDVKGNWRLVDFGMTCSFWNEEESTAGFTTNANIKPKSFEITCTPEISEDGGYNPNREVTPKMSWWYIFEFYPVFRVTEESEVDKEKNLVSLLLQASRSEGCVSRASIYEASIRQQIEKIYLHNPLSLDDGFVPKILFASVKQPYSDGRNFSGSFTRVNRFGVVPRHKLALPISPLCSNIANSRPYSPLERKNEREERSTFAYAGKEAPASVNLRASIYNSSWRPKNSWDNYVGLS